MVSDAISWDGPDLVLRLKVTPGAARDDMAPDGDALKVWIRAPANDGKANKSLIKWLGKQFRVPQSAIRIERGETARLKTVRISDPTQLPGFIIADPRCTN